MFMNNWRNKNSVRNGTIKNAHFYRDKDGINYIKSATTLLSLFDVLKIKKSQSNFMKVVNVDEELELQVEKSCVQNKDRLREILKQANFARFKNDCGLLKTDPYEIRGVMPGKQKQYSIGPGKAEILQTIDELLNRHPETDSQSTLQFVCPGGQKTRRNIPSHAKFKRTEQSQTQSVCATLLIRAERFNN